MSNAVVERRTSPDGTECNVSPHTEATFSSTHQAIDEESLNLGIAYQLFMLRTEESRYSEENADQPTQIPVSQVANKQVRDLVKKATATQKISYKHHPKLSMEEAEKIVAALKQLLDVELVKLKLRNCNITDGFLRKILFGTAKRKVQSLDLSGNEDLDMRTVVQLAEYFDCVKLDLSSIEFDRKQIESLRKMKELKVLKLKYSAFENDLIIDTLATLLNKGLEELSLVDSEISVQQLEGVAKAINQGINLKRLDLSHVVLGKEGIEAVSQLVNKTSGMKRLVLSDCGLNIDLLKDLQERTTSKIEEVIISSNPDVANDGIAIVAKLADQCACEKLDISSNVLEGKNIKELLSAQAPKQVRHLRISHNPCDDWPAVAQLVMRWGVKYLLITECRMTAEDITKFKEYLGDYKMKSVDVRDHNAIIYEEKEKALIALQEKSEEVIFKI